MGKIELFNFSAKSSFQHGTLFEEMLKLRYKGFIVEEKYDAFHCDGMEFDQYDNPFTQYAIATLNGSVVACARFGRTDIPYMARDVWAKQIPEENLPNSKEIYEFTRLYADSALTANLRNRLIRIISSYTYLCLVKMGAKEFYFVTFQSVFNSCAKLGFHAEIVCDINIEGYNNIKYCRAIVDKTKCQKVEEIMNYLIDSIDLRKLQIAA